MILLLLISKYSNNCIINIKMHLFYCYFWFQKYRNFNIFIFNFIHLIYWIANSKICIREFILWKIFLSFSFFNKRINILFSISVPIWIQYSWKLSHSLFPYFVFIWKQYSWKLSHSLFPYFLFQFENNIPETITQFVSIHMFPIENNIPENFHTVFVSILNFYVVSTFHPAHILPHIEIYC